jgi:DNA-binding MarR family transcriptional regulator
MDGSNQDVLTALGEIRDLLIPISACFEEQYAEIQRQRLGRRLEVFRNMMTETRKRILPLLFDPRGLSQVEIAELANTTQPTVSRLVNSLLEQGLISEIEDADGRTKYKDIHRLMKELEVQGS